MSRRAVLDLKSMIRRVASSKTIEAGARAKILGTATELLAELERVERNTTDGRVRSGRRDHAISSAKAGDRFGRLEYLEATENDPHYGAQARYRCDCGEVVERTCAFIRLQVRRSEERAQRTGKRSLGPGCGPRCPLLSTASGAR